MILEGADLVKLSKLTFQQVDHVTCLECCKYYIAPETATCGHTLCHSCWKGQRSCPICKLPLERKALKLNLPAQTLTEHVHQLVEAFEKLFNIKLDQVISYAPNNEESENDPTKHVKDWLASSQNNFSAPLNSEKFSQETVAVLCNEVSSSKIQVHTNTKKKLSSEKVLHMQVPQDDWDKIETLPDTENFTKNKENIVGPMDIEPYFFDDNEYTSENPRRSSRKRELKSSDNLSKAHDSSTDKPSSKDSSEEIDKKSNKMKQNWGNVKKMRKEFSKLNKINKNKLNVSIEMCKKTQSTKLNLPTLHHVSQRPLEIDENTPGIDINVPADNIEDNPSPKDNNNANIMNRDDNNITDNCIRLINESGKQNNTNNHNDSYEKKIEDKNNTKLHEINHVENSRKTNKNADECDNVKVPDIVRMPFFKKGALYHESNGENSNNNDHVIDPIQEENNKRREDTENIEITIKIGNTIANIFIKKKDKDVQLNVKTDQEIQTTLEPHEHSVNNIKTSKDVDVQTVNICFDENTNKVEVQSSTCNINNDKALQKKQIISNLNKSLSTKKNTASAETVTAHFEITESIEKELSNVMECVEPLSSEQNIKQSTNNSKSQSSKSKQNPTKILDTPQNMEYLNDVDIFYSGSIKESNVQLLKNSNHAPSEILDSTVMTYKNKLKHPDKRERDTNDDDEVPSNKKQKTIFTKKRENKLETCVMENKVIKNDSGNYDTIMGQVFASIDADIDHNKQNMKKCKQNPLSVLHNNDNTSSKQINISRDNEIECTSILKECFNDKYSENVFTTYEKVYQVTTIDKEGPENTHHKQDLLTPVSVREMESQRLIRNQDIITVDREESTPYQEQDDDSDKSIVEETPQKNLSFSKHKQKSNIANQSQRLNLDMAKANKQLSDTQNTKSIIILSNTEVSEEASKSNRDETVIEKAHNQMLETPLTINKFVDQIKYKSTPVAKKSLNFKQNDDEKDPEQTLCPSADVVANTTQEKEFLTKAFENTPSPVTKQLARSIKGPKKLCIAGSCLTSPEIAKLKLLCLDRKWTYADKYTKEVTHLVVGVDDENKSQRSVKYMCSLAAGKWIVSFEWIENILKTKNVVDEACYEALDSTGEPGPRRSRLASNRNQKLFHGITFYCMPPFSVLDVDTLQGMLEAAGGRVVDEASGVLVTDGSRSPALLLAEPENTQEDRFIYLAMELRIVPVNYEWVLNCLGSYTLVSIQEMLLCPASLLPAATAKWPHELLARED